MKRHFRIVFIVLLLAVVGFVSWRLLTRRQHQDPGVSRDTEPGASSTRPSAPARSRFPSHVPALPPPAAPSNALPEYRQAQMEAAAESLNVPITFWGKVIDQDGQPLPGVEVTMSIRQEATSPFGFEATFKNRTKVTGSDGRFAIDDGRGSVLTIKSIEKDGYRVSPGALRSFGYNISTNHIPRREEPVVFQMWKIGTPESLSIVSKFFNNVIPDGRYYTFDLLKATLHEGPGATEDIVWRVTRPDGVAQGDRYDWSLDLKVPSGGLLETDDASAYMVPESGYSPEYSFSMAESQRVWRGGLKKAFFIKSRGGQLYGSLTIDVYAFYNGKAAVGLRYTVNPAGSRNLQPGGSRLAPDSH